MRKRRGTSEKLERQIKRGASEILRRDWFRWCKSESGEMVCRGASGNVERAWSGARETPRKDRLRWCK